MSEVDYDALTHAEREHLNATVLAVVDEWDHGSGGIAGSMAEVAACVERTLQARLLDLAQRAEAAEAALERVRTLADEFERLWNDPPQKWRYVMSRTLPTVLAIDAAKQLRAALDPKEDHA